MHHGIYAKARDEKRFGVDKERVQELSKKNTLQYSWAAAIGCTAVDKEGPKYTAVVYSSKLTSPTG